MPFNPQAVELNNRIDVSNPHVLKMLSDRGKSIFFPRLGIISQAADARGKEINATIGTALEEDGSPMRLPSIAGNVALDPGEAFPYAPSSGKPEIRPVWKEMMLRKNPSLRQTPISTPVVTAALTQGLTMAAYLFVDPGERVILPDLYWENYNLTFGISFGAVLDGFPMFADGGFNVAGLKEKLEQGAPGKRIVLLNFPNNPTGYTVTRDEAEAVVQVLVDAADNGNEIVVLIDDAYFGLVFDEGIITESIFARLAGVHERILAVKLDGPTKEDYVWGFRVGFMTFGIKDGTPELYAALESKLSGAIRGSISNVSHIGQSLLLRAYNSKAYAAERREKYDLLKSRCEKIRSILKAHPEYEEVFTALPFNSGYFMCVRVNVPDPEAYRRKLLDTYSTGIIVLDNLVRVAFSSTPLNKLEKLFDNLYRAGRESGAEGLNLRIGI